MPQSSCWSMYTSTFCSFCRNLRSDPCLLRTRSNACRDLASLNHEPISRMRVRPDCPTPRTQLLLRLMSVKLMSLTTSTSIDTIARKVQSNFRNMPDDNELRFFLRWARLFFWDERDYSHKELLGNGACHVVLESYPVQAWGLLWCFYSDGLSEQLITSIRAFQYDNSSFLHASFSTRALGTVLYNILAQKMVEYRPASDRSFLHVEFAYFTQFLLFLDNSDDVFGIMVFDEFVKKKIWAEGTRSWLNHSFDQKSGVCGCLICVSFVLQEPSWSIQQIDVLPLRSQWL
jgi:hypothetical protein